MMQTSADPFITLKNLLDAAEEHRHAPLEFKLSEDFSDALRREAQGMTRFEYEDRPFEPTRVFGVPAFVSEDETHASLWAVNELAASNVRFAVFDVTGVRAAYVQVAPEQAGLNTSHRV